MCKFQSIADVPHECNWCDNRHRCFLPDEFVFSNNCKYFKIGGCLTCQYHGLNGEYFDESEADNPEGRCVSVNAFDFQKCENYKRDKKLWKQWKKVKRNKKRK